MRDEIREHHVVAARKLSLKAEVDTSTSQFSFKRLVQGGFNLGLIGSTCTALPCTRCGSALPLCRTWQILLAASYVAKCHLTLETRVRNVWDNVAGT
jgi:hypothetical protein